jgi:hypothetical protein
LQHRIADHKLSLNEGRERTERLDLARVVAVFAAVRTMILAMLHFGHVIDEERKGASW